MRNYILILFVSFCFMTGSSAVFGQKKNNVDVTSLSEREIPVKDVRYTDVMLTPAERVKDVIKHMTFEEKLQLTGGQNGFYFTGLPRLGLRPVGMSDASQGVHLRKNIISRVSTSFPGMLALASTWDSTLARTYGEKMGEECRALGVDILLGPGINMYRTSVGGRNYEYMGEDPFLTSVIATGYINGLQSKKIIAVAKHYIANDQEFCRHIVSCDIDERTLREIYLPPWEAVIRNAHVKGVMTANNLVNGIPNSMNKPLMADILRKEYGFSGIAMTDWQNTIYHPGKQDLVLPSGVSLFMPSNETFAGYVSKFMAVNPSKKSEVEPELEQMVYDNLLPLFEMGIYDRQAVDSSCLHTIIEHKAFARQCAGEAICLLKNENQLLPVSLNKKILLTGETEIYSGLGSGFVLGFDHTDFASGLKEVYGPDFNCIVKPTDEEIRKADVVLYRLNKPAGEGGDVPFYEPAIVNDEILHCASINPNVIVIICSGNGLDMPWLPNVKGVLYANLLGQERGNALADIISGKVNPSGHLPFTIEKKFEDSPAPEFNFIGGKPYWHGNNSFYKEYWLGKPDAKIPEIAQFVKPGEVIHKTYSEGIFIGYRWYEKKHIPVQFPFGFGLSYTTFNYSNLKVSSGVISRGEKLKIRFEITNTGKMAGATVAQLYIQDVASGVERPLKELKGFKKLFLKQGETKTCEFTIDQQDLSFWDVVSKKWKAESGKFNVLIGSSSADIQLNSTFNFN